ncbi:MAG: insulinase family protein [Xanthomonadaceae bacterium]|nr:insulinase family protein [Xanthomonadaceae bacterium]
MSRLAAMLLLAVVAGCQRQAAPAAATGSPLPPIAAARASTMPAPIESTLANGLRVIVLPSPGRSLVAAEFLLLSGGEVDPPDRAGLADFTASLLTQGTQSPAGARSAPQLAAAAEALGGSLHAQAGWDASRIGITVTTPKLAAALDLLADVVRHPAFAADEVERLRGQTLDALRLSLTDPGELADLVAARRVHGEAIYGHPRTGSIASIERITRAELRALHARHYRPDNAVLVLAGDLDPETGQALAAQIFGDWLPGKTPLSAGTVADPAAAPRDPLRPPAADVLIVDLKDAGQATVVIGTALPSRAAPDYYVGLVTAAVLGGGYSSRLNQEIRIKRGLSYSAHAEFSVQRGAGALYANAQTKNESAAEVLALIRGELLRLASETVPADELAARKAGYGGRYQRALQTAGGLVDLISGQVAKGQNAGEMARVTRAIDTVTAGQMRDYAHQHLPASAWRMVIVGDARQFAGAVRAQGLRVEVIPVEQLDLDRADLRPAAIR